MTRKLLVVGLDCAAPKLLYEEFRDELPTLSMLTNDGLKAELVSCHPPITIPAWGVMVTGKTPGELGLYGFRHRKPGSYNEFYIANSRSIKANTVWNVLGRHDMNSIVVGVPPSYPPRPIKGVMVSCFLTPSSDSVYTFPPAVKHEIESRFGKYVFDVIYRSEDRDRILREVWNMTKQHFQVLRYLAASRKWDFFMFVEIGVDRIHHAFWGYMDKEHHKYTPNNKYESVIKDYYKLVDEELKKLLDKIPKDTVVMVVSDHGAKRMKGAFVVNRWLAEKGYLRILDDRIRPGTELKNVKVDWSKTIAWGWGGYYARIFLNVKGREPLGCIDPREYEDYRDMLIDELKKIRGPNGEKWNTKAYRPEDLYPEVKGDPPDLIVYFDDLYWRSAGTLGWNTLYLKENDRGPDDAVHDWYGVLSICDPEETISKSSKKVRIEQVHDLMLEVIGLKTIKI